MAFALLHSCKWRGPHRCRPPRLGRGPQRPSHPAPSFPRRRRPGFRRRRRQGPPPTEGARRAVRPAVAAAPRAGRRPCGGRKARTRRAAGRRATSRHESRGLRARVSPRRHQAAEPPPPAFRFFHVCQAGQGHTWRLSKRSVQARMCQAADERPVRRPHTKHTTSSGPRAAAAAAASSSLSPLPPPPPPPVTRLAAVAAAVAWSASKSSSRAARSSAWSWIERGASRISTLGQGIG